MVLGHPRQAENARRLNVIDEKQYKKALEKHTAAAAATADQRKSCEQRLREFQESGGFISDLPTDKDARGKTVRGSLVPEPGYYNTRIADLTDDQQAEYSRAFSSRGSLALSRKYLFVRLVSLLESVLRYPNGIDAGRALDEAAFLETLHDASQFDVAATIQALADQDINERKSRAALVAAIEEAEAGPLEHILADRLPPSLGGPPLSPKYMQSILRPVADLEVMLRRGRFPESALERRDKEVWNRDMKALQSRDVRASGAAALAATKIAKTDPNTAVAAYAQHCETLLRTGQSMVHVDQLQLGGWIDKLTGALVRLSRLDEAAMWLERYFGLPERYRERSSQQQGEQLRRRLDRCKAKKVN